MKIIVGRGRTKASQRVEISDPSVSREHCWLSDNGDGTYSLENKSPNGTFVNGVQVLKTTVTPDTVITLSASTSLKVKDLLPPITQEKPSAPSSDNPKEFSIKALEAVWNEYHDKLLDIQKRQKKINLLRSASPIFTIGSVAIATIAKSMDWSDIIFGINIVMTVIGLAIVVYSFAAAYTDKSIEERDSATEKFTQRYVCPNPDCKHFMGNQPYNVLRQNKSCPWCRCKFKE